MNFKKLMAIVVPIAVVIFAWQYFSRVDRSDPVKVATAFTKALHSRDVSGAARYYVPDDAEAWQETFSTMKSGATDRYFEHIPAAPEFGAPVTSPQGVTTLVSSDKSFSVEMKQVGGKWYVSKAM